MTLLFHLSPAAVFSIYSFLVVVESMRLFLSLIMTMDEDKFIYLASTAVCIKK